MLIILFLCLHICFFAEAKFVTKVEQVNGGVQVYAYKDSESTENYYCSAFYNNTYKAIGWDSFQVKTLPRDTGSDQVTCAGYLEGFCTYKAIYIHYHNTLKHWCNKRQRICRKIRKFLETHFNWLEKTIEKKAAKNPFWQQVKLWLDQVKGIFKGYSYGQTVAGNKLNLTDLVWLNLLPDLEDVAASFSTDTSAKLRGNTRCSAIIKLLDNNTDLFVGHNTWNEYSQMYRILKMYDIPINMTDNSKQPVPGTVYSFSGYPGVITSMDDFYVRDKMVAMETTIGNSNASRWQYVKPTGQVFESIRSLIAVRLAKNGSSWCKIFSKYNSGTYNNQWMIVDYNKFKPGQPPANGTLWVLEQIPGYTRYEDQTVRLIKQRYWPSYNIPFYTDVFNLSGNQELVDRYGDWFSYSKTPRALIFKRDNYMVKNLASLLRLLRSNNYTKDPYSACNCTPPYSAENAIAARSDLNPKNGSYPFPALGHRPHGAIDAKATCAVLAVDLTFLAVCGPSTGANLPPFSWNTSDFNNKVPHIGQPDTFNFNTILPRWRHGLVY